MSEEAGARKRGGEVEKVKGKVTRAAAAAMATKGSGGAKQKGGNNLVANGRVPLVTPEYRGSSALRNEPSGSLPGRPSLPFEEMHSRARRKAPSPRG
jgi:hypothetical protein